MSQPPPESAPSRRDWNSLTAVLIVQAQNAFNDNFVKMVLMALAMAVASESAVGDNIEFILAAMIPVPFILLAPIAGFFSDRFPKRDVIFYCVIAQLVIFLFIGASVWAGQIVLAVSGFFLLAIQSTIFSPAKQGILKELVGSERLGFANGLMSMLTMVGILGGMFLGGLWFDGLFERYNEINGQAPENAWKAALIPIMAIGLGSLIPLAICRFIESTPAHRQEVRFTRAVWVRHFVHLAYVFRQPVLRLTVLYITWYWFIANFLGLGMVAFAKELFPDASRAGRIFENSKMLAVVGIGLIIGSIIVSLMSRKHILLKLVPLGGFGITLGLVGAGLFEPASMAWFLSLGFIGFASGFFLVPLSAHLQDRAEEAHRGRVISAQNLMTSFSGVVAILTGLLLKNFGLSPSQQVLLFSIPTALISLAVIRTLPLLKSRQSISSLPR